MRHVVLDTETTGPSSKDGDRVIQASAVELYNRVFTGRTFNTFVNPQGRKSTYDSYQVHKISETDLENAPDYATVHPALVEFIGDAMLVIHNKRFDLDFLNTEAERIGTTFEFEAVDTTDLSLERWPGQAVNLNAVIKRLGLDTTEGGLRQALAGIDWDREIPLIDRARKHDALVDCIWTAIAFQNLTSAHELDLSQGGGRAAKPWPFAAHRIPVVPLRTDILC